MAIRLLCLGLLLLSGSAAAALPDAAAYQHHARRWSVEQGLPQVTASAIAQDKQGFVWVGTQKGLARFDGTRFKVLDSSTHPLLHSNIITALAVDGDGRLWVGTNHGLSLYSHGHFIKLPAIARHLREVNALVASKGAIWIASEQGLFRVAAGRKQARAVPGWPAQSAKSVSIGHAGRLWVAVKNGVYTRPAGGTAFRFLRLPDDALYVHSLAWFNGHLWVGTNRGLYESDHERLVATQPELARRSIRALLAGPRHHLWIGTDASLFRLGGQGRLDDFSATSGLQGKWIWSLATDRNGDLWIGTATHGMIRLRDNHITWFGRSSGLTTPLVDAVYRDRDGSILVGGKSGAYRYHAGRFHLIHGQADLPNPLVHCFLRRQDGQLWIGTIGGLAIMQSGNSVALPDSLATLAHANIYNLHQDRDGTIWIGTTRGLFRYRHKQLRRFGKKDGLQQDFIRGIYRFQGGPLWVGTTGGLFGFSHQHFHRLCAAEHLNGQVLDVAHSVDGVAWIVSVDGSLFRYAAGRCKRYTFKSGPLSTSLYYATPGRPGTLWLTNDRGIYQIATRYLGDAASGDARHLFLHIIYRVDGTQRIHTVGGTPQSGLLNPDGNLWVPTINGLVVVDVDNPPPRPVAAPVVIEDIVRGSRTVSMTHPLSPVTLPPGKTNLRIEYASLDYRTPDAEHYHYRLSGYDTDWVDAGTRKEALYTHLPPGHYQFEVRADTSRDSGVAQTTRLDLTLQPRFYQTGWFFALLGLIAAGLVYAIYGLRMRHVRTRHTQLETLVATRTDELKEANRKLREASVTDPLTGLKNRRFFVDAVKKDIATLRRNAVVGRHDDELGFLILDLDDFKTINDTHGHQAGDAVLVQLGDLLTGEIRASDHVIRWGGEEFLIVARQTDREHIAALAEHLRATVADHAFKINGTETTTCTCSIGFCTFPFVPGAHDYPTWEGVVNLADAALYIAKDRGKNAWVGVKPTAAAATADAHALQPQLTILVEHGLATLEVFETAEAIDSE